MITARLGLFSRGFAPRWPPGWQSQAPAGIKPTVNFNSGTYNNQWIVVDLKQIESMTVYKNNFVWVSEQMPGYIVSEDVAHDMTYGGYYFPSYNTPFFDELWIVAGYPSVAEGDASYRYDKNPRGLMFARDVPQITGIDDMKRIMRYNKWQTDPLAITEGQTEPDPGTASLPGTICASMSLVVRHSEVTMQRSLAIMAIAGR